MQSVEACGNLIPTSRLVGLGFTRYQIAFAIQRGELLRVARGWVATAAAPQVAVAAVLHRGKLTGSSALASMLVWDAADPRVHVLVPRNSPHSLSTNCPLSTFAPPKYMKGPVVKHWGIERCPNPLELPWRVSIMDALLAVAHTAPPHQFVACLDSALHNRVINPATLATLESLLPRRIRRWIAKADGRAESGLETIVRILMAPLVQSIEIQVPIRGLAQGGGTGRLDILINGWLNIELDGLEFHTTSADHRRDAFLVTLGYRVHRFGWLQVIHNWPTVQATILELLRSPPARIPRQATYL